MHVHQHSRMGTVYRLDSKSNALCKSIASRNFQSDMKFKKILNCQWQIEL